LQGGGLQEDLVNQYKNIRKPEIAREKRLLLFNSYKKESKIGAQLSKRGMKPALTKKQVYNYCMLNYNFLMSCPIVGKYTYLRFTAGNFARIVYKVLEIFNSQFHRHINITYNLFDGTQVKNLYGSDILNLHTSLIAFITNNTVPKYCKEVDDEKCVLIENQTDILKSLTLATSNVERVKDSINYLVENFEDLAENGRFKNSHSYISDFINVQIIYPDNTNKRGIFTNINEDFYSLYPINYEDPLQASFDINANPNCVLYLYDLIKSSPTMSTNTSIII
jgi:hypothetical protein